MLYGKVKTFIRDYLFTPSPVDLEDPVVLRNLSEPEAGKCLFDSFKVAMNALTIRESGTSVIEDRIRLRDTRPFRTENRRFVTAKNSIFSKIVGEAGSDGFELTFAAFLRDAPDVQAFAKNYLAVGFKIDYVKADGDLSTYTPDFIVRTLDGTVWIVETKGREELDLPQKMTRLASGATDATAASAGDDGTIYRFVYVDQEGFDRHKPADIRRARRQLHRISGGLSMARIPKEAYELTDAEKRDLIALIQAGKPLPEKYRFMLFEDKREVELVWNGKSREVCTTILPFQIARAHRRATHRKRNDEDRRSFRHARAPAQGLDQQAHLGRQQAHPFLPQDRRAPAPDRGRGRSEAHLH